MKRITSKAPSNCERCRRLKVRCTKPLDQKTRLPCQRCRDDKEICEVKVAYPPQGKKTLQPTNAVSEEDRIEKFLLRTYSVQSQSVDARLGAAQRAFSLGNHLVKLAGNQVPFDISGPVNSKSGTYTLSWPQYWTLRFDCHPVDRIVDLWFKFSLARSAIWSPHSDIFGVTSNVDIIPHRNFNDPLLDLRSYGHRRQEARGVLTNACLSVAIAPDSPLRTEKTEASLSMTSTLLHTFNRPFQTREYGRALVQIAVDIFEALWKVSPPDRKRQLVNAQFELLILCDIRCCVDHGGPLIIPDQLLKKYLKGSEYPSNSFIDPTLFRLGNIPDPSQKDAFASSMWGFLMATLRHIIREKS
ncbi:hypothetical protein BT69DRAFT_767900 [Atractiella rhizophila]|nr:hypothetical protein BT69DRAFT_767900 [Atractiella rhizophila]